jgi:hypothetical protein
MEIRMFIKRILVASGLMFGVLHAHAASDGTDNHCVIGKNNSLFNQCNYSVDVGFCVENPQQTKHFFDNSKAFECPDGALIALPAGLQDGNILHGKVHWWACSTKHRGSFKWRFVEGIGYQGYCFKEKEAKTENPAPSQRTRASSGECNALQQRATQASGPGADRLRNYTMFVYLHRSCGNLTPQDRAAQLEAYQQEYLRLVSECRHSGARNCSSAATSNEVAMPERPSTPPIPTQQQALSGSSVPTLISRCSREIETATSAAIAYNRRTDGDRALSEASWRREWELSAQEEARNILAIPVERLREYHSHHTRLAAGRSDIDPNKYRELVRACMIKARMEGQ